jgi:hypothetical protein
MGRREPGSRRKQEREIMTELLLTHEQTKLLRAIQQPIPVRDADGNLIGQFEPRFSPQLIAELKRRGASQGPWYSGQQVQNRLAALQAEWDRRRSFDERTMQELLKEMDAVDPGKMKSQGIEE